MPTQKHILLSSTGSERATTGPGNNIVSRDGKTHVVWQDSNAQGYWAIARTLDHATQTWSDPTTIAPGHDNHARPCITIDSKGFLHVIVGGHGTMTMYHRSLKPHDSSAWSPAEPVGLGTYPMIACAADDTLALTYRDRPLAGIELLIRPAAATQWESRGLIFAKDTKYNKGYGGYNGAIAFGPDGKTLHFSADVYEGTDYYNHRGTHQAVSYAVTHDLGLTWRKADGSPLPKAPFPDQLDLIERVYLGDDGPTIRPVLRNGGVVVDNTGTPYVYLTHVVDNVGRPRLVKPNAHGGWRDLPLNQAVKKHWPDFEVRDARGHISRTDDDALHIIIMLSVPRPPDPINPKGTSIVEGRVPNFGVGLATTRDGGETFQTRDLIPYNPDATFHQVTLERPTGHQSIPALPPIIWTDGLHHYPEKGQFINTKVWYQQPI